MENEIIFIVEESPEGGWAARALRYSIFTEAESENELKVNIKEAVNCHFEEENVPKILRLHNVNDKFLKV